MSNHDLFKLEKKTNDVYTYFYFHNSNKTESTLDEWTQELLKEFFIVAHELSEISDIHMVGGKPISVKTITGTFRVSLSPVLVITAIVPSVAAEFLKTNNLDAQAVTSIGKSLSAKFTLARSGSEIFYSFRMQSLPFSNSSLPLSSLSVFRPTSAPPTMEQLKLPLLVQSLVEMEKKMILIVGSTGTGKSSTMFSIIAERLKRYPESVFTVEDPIEYDLDIHKCIGVSYQTDLMLDHQGKWENAEASLMRVHPDTILGGEIRDAESLKFPMNIARTNHRVFTTLHTDRPWEVPERIFNLLDSHQGKAALLEDLIEQLGCIVSQRLVFKNGGGKTCIQDVLIFSPENKIMIMAAIRDLASEKPYHDRDGYRLFSANDAFKLALLKNIKEGTGVSMTMMLDDLLEKKVISKETYDKECGVIDPIILESVPNI